MSNSKSEPLDSPKHILFDETEVIKIPINDLYEVISNFDYRLRCYNLYINYSTIPYFAVKCLRKGACSRNRNGFKPSRRRNASSTTSTI